jgi:hypothetical protein
MNRSGSPPGFTQELAVGFRSVVVVGVNLVFTRGFVLTSHSRTGSRAARMVE